MDGTRARRTRDAIRLEWYSSQRSLRFARRLGFGTPASAAVTSSWRSMPLGQLDRK